MTHTTHLNVLGDLDSRWQATVKYPENEALCKDPKRKKPKAVVQAGQLRAHVAVTDTDGGGSQRRSMGKASGASGALGDSPRVCRDGSVSVPG